MYQYPVQRYQQSELPALIRSINTLLEDIVNQAVQHPYITGYSTGGVVALAAKGFGAPNWLCVLIGGGVGYFTSEGLKKVKRGSLTN